MIYKIKRFARADYAGLSESQQAALRKERGEIAKQLLKKRAENNKALLEAGKETLMNQQSREHGRFVNEGLLRDNRVTKDAMGQIETRNYFGRKKTHTNADIQNLMNRNQDGFIFERGQRRDSHANSISDARAKAKAARERILGNKSQKRKSNGGGGGFSSSRIINNSSPISSNLKRKPIIGRTAGIAGGLALAGGLGYGAYRVLNKEEK